MTKKSFSNKPSNRLSNKLTLMNTVSQSTNIFDVYTYWICSNSIKLLNLKVMQ